MRTSVVTRLLIVGSAGAGAAQQPPESPWTLFSHVDAAAFVDAGNVAARVADLNLDKTSYGGRLRVHSRTSTLARLDVARSREGWLMSFKLSDPFRLARPSLSTTVVPFVP
jgi:hypothetical protein